MLQPFFRTLAYIMLRKPTACVVRTIVWCAGMAYSWLSGNMPTQVGSPLHDQRDEGVTCSSSSDGQHRLLGSAATFAAMASCPPGP